MGDTKRNEQLRGRDGGEGDTGGKREGEREGRKELQINFLLVDERLVDERFPSKIEEGEETKWGRRYRSRK